MESCEGCSPCLFVYCIFHPLPVYYRCTKCMRGREKFNHSQRVGRFAFFMDFCAWNAVQTWMCSRVPGCILSLFRADGSERR